MTNPPHSLSPLDRVLQAIDQGHAKMRSRWQFVVRTVAIASLCVLLALIVVFLSSLAIFTWRASGSGFLPHFGSRGWLLAFLAIPWWVILVAIIGCVGLIALLERTTPWYRQPAAMVFGGLMLVVVALSGVLASAGFHERFGPYVEMHNIPFLGPTYHELRLHESDVVTIGTITTVKNNRLTIQTNNNENLTIKLSRDTDLPNNWMPEIGDPIAVIGDRSGSTVSADACRPLGRFRPGRWFIPPPEDRLPESLLPVPIGPNWST